MNKRYQAGRNFEYRVKKLFESKGMFCIRSAGSHSPVDIVCFGNDATTRPLFIQCKAGKNPMAQKEETAFQEVAKKCSADTAIARKNNKGHIIFEEFV